MPAGDPTLPEGFPDLFVYALRDALETHVGADPEFPATAFLTRAVRPEDPSRTLAVVEGPASPDYYEMAASLEPGQIKYEVIVQAYVKAANEIEGRNIRKRLLQRARKTLFLNTTVNSLMSLSDAEERTARFRWRSTDFATVDAKDGKNQFFLLGQMHIEFWTDRTS